MVHIGDTLVVERCAAFAFAVAAVAFADAQVTAECLREHVFADQCVADVDHVK